MKMLFSSLAFVAVIVSSAPTLAGSYPNSQSSSKINQALLEKEKEKASENLLSRVDQLSAQVSSRNELLSYLSQHPECPLNKLPSFARSHFINSLVFSKGQLASYSYVELRDYMSVSETYGVLALFGAQRTIGSIPNQTRATDDLEEFILKSNAYKPNVFPTDKACKYNPDTGTSYCSILVGYSCRESSC